MLTLGCNCLGIEIMRMKRGYIYITCIEKHTLSYEPRREQIGLRGFRPGPTKTGQYSHRRWLEA